jgi:hypothetical protein
MSAVKNLCGALLVVAVLAVSLDATFAAEAAIKLGQYCAL